MRVGDLLFIRSGFVEQYQLRSAEENTQAATRSQKGGPRGALQWAGLAQEEKVLDWLHDSYFAAVAGDSPTFEAWPSREGMLLAPPLL